MIEGEYLTADDLGPLGRLVAPGELLVLENRDARMVHLEREWINARYLEADTRAEALRRRLKRSRLGAHGDVVRERFEDWTVEAAKLALIDRYLLMVAGQLDQGRQQALNPKKTFRWRELEPIQDVVHRVTAATDDEIVGGTVFRVR